MAEARSDVESPPSAELLHSDMHPNFAPMVSGIVPASFTDEAEPAVQFYFERRKILERLEGERQLCCSYIAGHIIVGCIICFYGGMYLFRNIAFFRHRGLISYADMVMPDTSSGPLTGALLVNSQTGESLPLRGFLSGVPMLANMSLWNVSVAADNRPDLSKLDGEPFALLDLAHEVLPDLSQAEWAVQTNELVASLFIASALVTFVVPFFVSFRGKSRPYFFGMVLRFVHALTSGNALRVVTYLSTSIPGPAKHCQSVHWFGKDGVTQGAEELNRQHVMTVASWFVDTWNKSNNSNCGDLVFSGHTFQAVTNAMAITYYAKQIFPDGVAITLIVVSWILLFIQVFFVLSTFNHYAVDTVISLYFSPLNWLFWHWLRPKDPTPESMSEGWLLQCWRFRPKSESAQT